MRELSRVTIHITVNQHSNSVFWYRVFLLFNSQSDNLCDMRFCDKYTKHESFIDRTDLT
jgi:hypothetical protein